MSGDSMKNDALALSFCMCVDDKWTESIALHLRPVAASGLFVPPKKVRTYVIYSRDECLRLVHRRFIYFQSEGEA